MPQAKKHTMARLSKTEMSDIFHFSVWPRFITGPKTTADEVRKYRKHNHHKGQPKCKGGARHIAYCRNFIRLRTDQKEICRALRSQRMVNNSPKKQKNPAGRTYGVFLGGLGRIRTADTRIFSPLLYQLSYKAVAAERPSMGLTKAPVDERAGMIGERTGIGKPSLWVQWWWHLNGEKSLDFAIFQGFLAYLEQLLAAHLVEPIHHLLTFCDDPLGTTKNGVIGRHHA